MRASRTPPLTFVQEKLKIDERLPAAQAFAREHKLNEFLDGDLKELGIIALGGLTNTLLRALAASASPTISATRASRSIASTSPIR
jgi:TPP-dependent indolepyruvate ferredoxin oxidoreductase alpha subunit